MVNASIYRVYCTYKFQMQNRLRLCYSIGGIAQAGFFVLPDASPPPILSPLSFQMKLELCIPKPGSDVSSLSRSACDRSFLCINSRPVAVKEIDKVKI